MVQFVMFCHSMSMIHCTTVLSTTQRTGVATRCTLLDVFAKTVATLEDGFWVVHKRYIFKPYNFMCEHYFICYVFICYVFFQGIHTCAYVEWVDGEWKGRERYVIGQLSEKINKLLNENEEKENTLKIQLKMQRKVLKSKDNIICFLATMCVAMFGLLVGIICKH